MTVVGRDSLLCASQTIAGQGLHTGARASIRFIVEPGPVRFRSSSTSSRVAVEARIDIDDLLIDGAARSTCVATRDGRLRVGTVEHLFAALGAMAIHEGVVVEIDGPEVPLVDGGAAAFVDALAHLGISPSSSPRLVVTRTGHVDVGDSRYELSPADRPFIEVDVDFGDERLARRACWNGDAQDFRSRIALARTFGFAHEVEHLLERGLASHVTPESVVVIAPDAILSSGPPFSADEPARHKLLDLIGDLYAYGGPPLGSIRATRPGHAATHEVMRRALERELVVVVKT